MFSFPERVIFLAVLLAAHASFQTNQYENLGSVLSRLIDILNDLLLSFDPGNKFLNVFVPPDCLKDNSAVFNNFLKSREETVTLWTDGKKHWDACNGKPCEKFRQLFFHMVFFICGKCESNYFMGTVDLRYFMTAFVVAENACHYPSDGSCSLQVAFLPPYRRASGSYFIDFYNGSTFLTSEFERNVAKHQTLASELLSTRRRTLNGNNVHFECFNHNDCEHPSFNVTLMLLAYRNASISPGDSFSNRDMYRSSFVSSLNNRPDKDASDALFALHHFGSAGYSFYVRKRNPVPKETIFILPFLKEVWIGLLVSCIFLVLTYGFIAKVTQVPRADAVVFIFLMVAAFLQQSVRLHSRLLNRQRYRVLYGVMALMFVVMSTVFKGRITSLLNNLPLDGEVAQFSSFEDLLIEGHRICVLDIHSISARYDSTAWRSKHGSSIKTGSECFHKLNSNSKKYGEIKIAADGKDTFFTFNFRTGLSEERRRELYDKGYVETEDAVFSYPVGPEMRASSVYRHDFDATLSRAVEAGLYERNYAFTEYKRRHFYERSLMHPEELVLNLGDLRPYFLAWLVGVSFSILVFIGESAVVRLACRNNTEGEGVIGKQPSRQRIRIAGTTKKVRRRAGGRRELR